VASSTRPGGGAAPVSFSCHAPAGVPFSYAIVSSPSHGTLSAINQGTGSLVYVSATGYHGSDQFSYDAVDAGGASNLATAAINVLKPIGTLAFATLVWTFHPFATYSEVVSMTGSDLPIGSRIILSCHGRGCKFRQRTVTVTRASRCRRTNKHCRPNQSELTRSVDLSAVFTGNRFPAGSVLTVRFVEAQFVGKAFVFRIRSNHQPSVAVTCLAPGSLVPGQGC
jgi:hypothetical protein